MSISPELRAAYLARRARQMRNGNTARVPMAVAAINAARRDVARGGRPYEAVVTYPGHGDVLRTRKRDGSRVTYVVAHIRYEDMGSPWLEHDGHGVIREVSRGCSKYASERLMEGNHRGATLYAYDIAETQKIALRDGWGLAPAELEAFERKIGRNATPRMIAAEAVRRDFERMRGWLNDEWHWVGVALIELPRGVNCDPGIVADRIACGSSFHDCHMAASLWGIESDSGPYLGLEALELLSEARG